MSYREEVVNTAIKSLEDAGFPGAVSLVLMFERVYDCGYNEARRTLELNQVKKTTHLGCSKCGFEYTVMGYVCPRSDCPTKVTCQ